MAAIRIGIVGVGKIARDQHIPALAADPAFDLVAAATRQGPPPEGLAGFRNVSDMIEGTPDLHAVSICTPPLGRYAIARAALERGVHVMLEKPPGATLSEVEDLVALAREKGVALFATWHSREAPAVAPARAWLKERTVRAVRVAWKEDVRIWHPGQAWIWEPGGLGVFDPGINALSIVTRILPRAIFLTGGELFFPANRAAPIAADLRFTDAGEAAVEVALDWRQTGPQSWDIEVDTDAGALKLTGGGSAMHVDGETHLDAPETEYPNLYARFAQLVPANEVDVDLAPLRHVADAFMLGRRVVVEPFED